MYQIAQEAVENAVQHSSCSAIEIAVKSTRTGTVLEVRDNGRGFDPADLVAGRRGLGLLSMEHYAAQAGLDLSITSTRRVRDDGAGRDAGDRREITMPFDIVLVDDHKLVRDGVKTILERGAEFRRGRRSRERRRRRAALQEDRCPIWS